MEEGLTTEYHIYQTVNGGDQGYNLILVTAHPNLAAFDATDELRRKIDRITEKVEAVISEEETDEITAKVYPNIRDILSDRWGPRDQVHRGRRGGRRGVGWTGARRAELTAGSASGPAAAM